MELLTKRMKSLFLAVALLAGLGMVDVSPALEIGDKAPDFTLPSTTGQKISLSEFRGKKLVLLEFYVNDFGATWSKNLSARKVDYDKFQTLDVQVLGISANDSFSQKTFADSLKLPYPLLSDHPDLRAIRSYGGPQPYPKDPNRQVARRTFFLIDKQGIVRGRWIVGNKTLLPSEDILKVARKIAGKP